MFLLLLAATFWTNLGPSKPLTQWVPAIPSSGAKRMGRKPTTHLQLVPRSSMSTSYSLPKALKYHCCPWFCVATVTSGHIIATQPVDTTIVFLSCSAFKSEPVTWHGKSFRAFTVLLMSTPSKSHSSNNLWARPFPSVEFFPELGNQHGIPKGQS